MKCINCGFDTVGSYCEDCLTTIDLEQIEFEDLVAWGNQINQLLTDQMARHKVANSDW